MRPKIHKNIPGCGPDEWNCIDQHTRFVVRSSRILMDDCGLLTTEENACWDDLQEPLLPEYGALPFMRPEKADRYITIAEPCVKVTWSLDETIFGTDTVTWSTSSC